MTGPLRQIDLTSALTGDWDVVVAGSSFAAMFFVLGLPKHLKVLVVEKGPLQPHAAQLTDGIAGLEQFDIRNHSGTEKQFIAHSLFGGNSNCWWGNTPRFHPNDFRLRSLYGIGEDWPLDYAALEPFYSEVEATMEISGGGSTHLFPRSVPYPFPPHAGSRSDIAIAATDLNWLPVATARSNGGSRPNCCANGVCSLCPVDAKFTVLNAQDSFARDTVAVLAEAEMRRVEIVEGRARSVEVLHAGQLYRIAADHVALGANAIFNAAILLRSGLVAPALGRYLHEQLGHTMVLDINHDNLYGGTSITGLGYDFYDGPHRAERAAVLIENYNVPAFTRAEPGRWTQRMSLRLVAEDIPRADNRVLLENDAVVIDWQGFSDYAREGLRATKAGLGVLFPFAVERVLSDRADPTEAHIQGTHRMGPDPSTAVTDADLRCHGVPNLWALGAGAFPSGSPANPTLTLSALSLRAGRQFNA